MGRTKDHYTCKSCGELDEEVPSNGGWCERCGAHHGWTHLAEGSIEEAFQNGEVIVIDEPEPEPELVTIDMRAIGIELVTDGLEVKGCRIHFFVHIHGCGRDERGIMIMGVNA